MLKRSKLVVVLLLVAAFTFSTLLTGCGSPSGGSSAPAQPTAQKQKLRVGISIYTGWMFHYLMAENGTLKKWSDKYSVEIEYVPMSYGASLDAYAAGQIDAVVVTNMEGLYVLSAAHPSRAIIVGDYSNGNDRVGARKGITLSQLKGRSIMALDKSVSVYLIARALELKTGIRIQDVHVSNTSDEEIAGLFLASKSAEVVSTWNPMMLEISDADKSVQSIFDSSQIPGEIQDLLVINERALARNEDFGRALTGAWYETLAIVNGGGALAEQAIARMAELSKSTPNANGTPEFFKRQLATTYMFWTAKEALKFTTSGELKEKMNLVRQFCFSYGLFGENIKSADEFGIKYPDGTIQGNANNVRFTYDATFMKEYAEGKIK